MPAALKALLAQLGGFATLYMLGRSGVLPELGLLSLAAVQALAAAFCSACLRSDRWWIPIHLLFTPLIVIASRGSIPAWVYLAGLVGLVLIYWSSFRTQVPLFLSNKHSVHRLAAELPDAKPLKVLDIGSGTGAMLKLLARLRPDWALQGVETAPAPFWISRQRLRHLRNVTVDRHDFWQKSLRDFDVVYAFLSPVPMRALWAKAVREMRPGTLLVSNTFEIPNIEPEKRIQVGDARHTQLLFYRMPIRERK